MVISIIANSTTKIVQNSMEAVQNKIGNTYKSIASGTRLFDAAQDPAALTLGTSLATDEAAYKTLQNNIGQASATLQIADGAIGTIQDILQRMTSLASSAENDAVSSTQRAQIDAEYQQLLTEINNIGANTQFNGQTLLGGASSITTASQDAGVSPAAGFSSFAYNPNLVSGGDNFTVSYDPTTKLMTMQNTTQGTSQSVLVATPSAGNQNTYSFGQLGVTISLNSAFDDTAAMAGTPGVDGFSAALSATPAPTTFVFQVGLGTTSTDQLTVNLPVINATALGLAGSNLLSSGSAASVMDALKAANDTLGIQRASLGANMSQLSFQGNSISSSLSNLENARSTYMDADMSTEVSDMVTNQALLQAGTAVLSQANSQADMLLKLIGAN